MLERSARDLLGFAVEDVGALPRRARLPQLDVGLGVAGDQHRRHGDRAERLDRALEAPVHRCEVTGADHDVRLLGNGHEALGTPAISVQVAGCEESHR